jgi:hypothetical protein
MEDSRTYSDEGAKAVRWAIERLADRFIASDEHQTLIDQASHRQQTRSILTLTADVCYSYQLERPEEWTTMGMGEVLGASIERNRTTGASELRVPLPDPGMMASLKKSLAALHDILTAQAG